MKITVIGGSGFIGTVLVRRLLAAGHAVTIADTAASAAYPDLCQEADVRDIDSLRKICTGAEAVYNLAAVHRDDVRPVSLYDEVNVAGAENICRAAAEAGVQRQIFTSTVAVYGFTRAPADETASLTPFNDYGRTKAAAEEVYGRWQAADPSRALTIVRPTAVFGPGNRGNVYTLMNQIATGRFLMIGDGTNVKSIAAVENVAAFLVHALARGDGAHIYNYVDKPDFTTKALVSLIREALGREAGTGPALPYALGMAAGGLCDALAAVTGKTFPVSRVRVQKFCANTVYKADRAGESGFVPPVSLEAALREMIAVEYPREHTPSLRGAAGGEAIQERR